MKINLINLDINFKIIRILLYIFIIKFKKIKTMIILEKIFKKFFKF